MTNFDFLKQEPKFNSFSDVAVAAEKILNIDIESSVINCRRAMEFAIKWMYSVDKSLDMPYQDNISHRNGPLSHTRLPASEPQPEQKVIFS